MKLSESTTFFLKELDWVWVPLGRSTYFSYPQVALNFFIPMESPENGHRMSLTKCLCLRNRAHGLGLGCPRLKVAAQGHPARGPEAATEIKYVCLIPSSNNTWHVIKFYYLGNTHYEFIPSIQNPVLSISWEARILCAGSYCVDVIVHMWIWAAQVTFLFFSIFFSYWKKKCKKRGVAKVTWARWTSHSMAYTLQAWWR